MVPLIRSTRVGGHFISYGVLDETPVNFSWYEAFARLPRIDIFTTPRFTGDVYFGTAPDEPAVRRAKQFITGGVGDGSLPVHIGKVFKGIESLPDAFNHMNANVAGGKLVVEL